MILTDLVRQLWYTRNDALVHCAKQKELLSKREASPEEADALSQFAAIIANRFERVNEVDNAKLAAKFQDEIIGEEVENVVEMFSLAATTSRGLASAVTSGKRALSSELTALEKSLQTKVNARK
jgi:hypothetical protein